MAKRQNIPLDPSKPADAMLVAAGFPSYSAWQLTSGHKGGDLLVALKHQRLPPNHPFIPDLARTLNTSDAKIVELFSARGKPLLEMHRQRIMSRAKTIASGGGQKAKRQAKPVVSHGGLRSTRNSLKRRQLSLREATRTLISTVNLATMEGAKTITAPTPDLITILTDYMERCHVKGHVLLDPHFAERFG